MGILEKREIRTFTDTEAMDRIAVLLGSHREWPSHLIESVAVLVVLTGRPDRTDQDPNTLEMYRRHADRLGYEHDGS